MSNPISAPTRARFGASIVTLAPAVLPGMEFAPLAVSEPGADVQAVQVALAPWFLTILMTGAATFAIGVFAFAKGIADSRVLSRRLSRLVVGALVVIAGARLVVIG